MSVRLAAVLALALLTAPARAQSIPPVGAEATLDVASWNVEWFGSEHNGPDDDAAQLGYVADVIAASGIDLWALQEISDVPTFDALLAALGADYAGALATNSGQQRIGFVYHRETIRARSVQHLFEDQEYAFAYRPPLQLEAEVVLADTSFVAKFVVVHMKAFGDRTSYERRVDAARLLKNRFDFFEASTPLLLLGDYNDELLASTYAGARSPFAPFLEDPDDYAALTLPIERANRATYCGGSPLCSGNSTIDHIIATDEFARAFVSGSADRYEALLTAVPNYTTSTSDHLPVVARFAWGTTVSVERPAALDAAPAPYPSPFTDALTVPYALDAPGAVTLSVYDLLGREVARSVLGARAAGADAATLRIPGPPGVYLVRVEAGGGVTTRRVVKR